MVIGRFLMGAALGGLVGGGALALVSLVAAPPAPRDAANRDAAPLAAPGATPDAAPEAVVAPSAETPEAGATPSSGGDVSADAAVPDAADALPLASDVPQSGDAPPAVMPDAAPDAADALPSVSDAPDAVTPDVAPEAADAPLAAMPDTPPVASDAAPLAPAVPDAGAVTGAPDAAPDAAPDGANPVAPSAPVAEAAPDAPAQPAAAPDLALDAPEAALTPPAPQDSAATTLPGAGASPAPAADPALAAPSGSDTAPVADLPVLPPLTPEEEALIAGMAEPPADLLPPPEPGDVLLPDAAAIPDSAIVLPEGAFPEPAPGQLAPDAPLADAPLADAPETAPPAPDAPTRPAVRRVGAGEGSTLPATPPLAGASGGALPEIATPGLPDTAEAAAPASTRPLDLYARPFTNPEAKPLYAVILMDDGAADLDRAALADLPFPVTFALDPQAPGAAEHAAIYRAAGQEVVMLATGLPQGATASDVETAFSVMAAALPQAVAVMDMPGRSFQADRPLATLVVPVVGAEGRGLVTWDEGLNAADQVARREDVPTVAAFRHLDAADESGPVIRRYLDRAAFKAAQEGAVLVVGRTRTETVAALLEWTVEGRAASVALAPVTAVLSVD